VGTAACEDGDGVAAVDAAAVVAVVVAAAAGDDGVGRGYYDYGGAAVLKMDRAKEEGWMSMRMETEENRVSVGCWRCWYC